MNRKLELVTNAAIAGCCVLLAVTLVRYYWIPSSLNSRGHQMQVGDPVAISGINWRTNGKTLALQTSCHFCTESAPFYKRLSEATATRRGLQMVAVFPQPVDVSAQYLSQLDVPIHSILQVRFVDMRVVGTPTILLVDASGRIERFWIGKLGKADEDAVLSVIGAV